MSFSSPSVRLFGVVVRVISDDPIIRYVSLIVVYAEFTRPCFVMVSFQKLQIASPGVRKILNTMVIIIRTTIAFIPLTINLNGTFDITIAKTRNTVAIA